MITIPILSPVRAIARPSVARSAVLGGPAASSAAGAQARRGVRGALVTLAAAVVLAGCVSVDGGPRERPRDAAQYNAELGARYLGRGDLEQARVKLEKALEQDEDNALAHRVYAELQHRVGEESSARKHFRTAIRLAPDEAEHRNSFGIFLCQVDDHAAAEKQFLEAADNPYYRTPEFALDNAGLCMLDANREDDAEGYLRRALRANPQFANAYLHMAELMHRKRRLTVADAYYQRYLAYAEQTPESLLLGLGIKRDVGDRRTAERYASRLLNEFPASREAGEYLARPLPGVAPSAR